jgi:hypothetical protein
MVKVRAFMDAFDSAPRFILKKLPFPGTKWAGTSSSKGKKKKHHSRHA